ncbi:MAG: response regulator transcription factor [Planctomycetota bacterium]
MGNERATLLLVEDDEPIRTAIAEALRLDGYTVLETATLGAARAALSARAPDLVLLDVMLPDGSGLELLAEIRASGSEAPVLVLTAKGSEEDRVLGFEHGCDDYVVKPFSLQELRLRLRALLRRSRVRAPTEARVRIGEALIDLEAYTVERAGRRERLSPKERDMLLFLLQNPGIVITRNRFLNEVWGYESYPTTRTVDMHVLKLRQKIEHDPERPRHLVTVHGAGYRFDP